MLNSLKIGRIPPTGLACGFPPTIYHEKRSRGYFKNTKHQKKSLTGEAKNARMLPVKLNNIPKQCHNNNNLLFGVLVLI